MLKAFDVVCFGIFDRQFELIEVGFWAGAHYNYFVVVEELRVTDLVGELRVVLALFLVALHV